jgi:hypothetical protein
LVVRDGATGCWYGLLYDNLAEGAFDLGCEHSNYYVSPDRAQHGLTGQRVEMHS